MARKPRVVVPGCAMHVVQRGNNKQATFFAEEDYETYLCAVASAAETYEVDVHCYVLMTNHVHLLLTPLKKKSLSGFMQSIGRRYVRYVNRVYQRTGTLWEGRFKSGLVDAERYLMACYRYIEMNPVRAGMVSMPGEYKWSSYCKNALGFDDLIVIPHSFYERLGSSHKEREHRYRVLFDDCVAQKNLSRIRSGTEADGVIGNERFVEQIEVMLNRRVRKSSHGGDRRSDEYHSSILTP